MRFRSLFSSPRLFTGVDTSHTCVRVASIQKEGDSLKILSIKELEKTNSKDLIENRESVVVSTLPSKEILTRSCSLPVTKKKDLERVLDFQIEPLIPYPLEQALIQVGSAEKQTTTTQIVALIARKDHLQGHIEKCRGLGFEPEVVSCVPLALATLSKLLCPPSPSPSLFIAIAQEEVCCALIEKGELIATRVFDGTRHLENEMQKSVLYFSNTYKTKKFDAIFVLNKDPLVLQRIQKATGKTVQPPLSILPTLSQDQLIHFGVAIGLALASEKINFRQNSPSFSQVWQRLKRPFITYCTLSVLTTLILCALGFFSLFQQKKVVGSALFSLLKEEGISPPTHSPKTSEGYVATLSKLEKQIHERPNTYPLFPRVPKVRDFLGWLTSLRETESIDFSDFHYSMVSAPSFSNRSDHYKIKVELELIAKTPQSAHRFHETLLAPNDFVSDDEEVTFSTAKGKYFITLYLKDRTNYL